MEAVIKELGLDRSRVFEADKWRYAQIIQKIQETFVQDSGSIHWANMGYFRPELAAWTVNVSDKQLWYHELSHLVPKPEEMVYVDVYKRQHQRYAGRAAGLCMHR